MSVWCVSLMALLGRLAQETQGDSNIEEMLKNAAGALRQIRDLVAQRAKSMNRGALGKVAAFWTASAYQKEMKIASEWMQKAIQALSLSVSAQTKAQVVQVLDKVELLPRMDAKLDAMNDKMDQVFDFVQHLSSCVRFGVLTTLIHIYRHVYICLSICAHTHVCERESFIRNFLSERGVSGAAW